MGKILILTPQIPYPPRQGTALRNWGILRGLAAHHDVSLLTFAAPDQDTKVPAVLSDIVERVAVLPQPVRTMKDRLRDLLIDPRPDLLLRLESQAFRAQLRAWLAAYPFDWVQAEGLELTGYLDEVWRRPNSPRVIFDDHNCEYLLQQRACRSDLRHPSRWMGAAYSAVQWRRLRHHEADICRRADLAITVSQADASALRSIVPGFDPLVIPNGISVADYVNFDARESLNQPALVFTGTMDFRPNVDGVLWFVHKVWPSIQDLLPDAHFYIVGRHPHQRLESLRTMPGIVITGSVPDTRPYINAAAVYVVPLLVGGGTRLKILESTAMGKAVVSTTLGAEGFSDAENVLILADDASAFAEACIRQAQDTTVGEGLADQGPRSERARRFAEAYDWDVLLPVLLERLKD